MTCNDHQEHAAIICAHIAGYVAQYPPPEISPLALRPDQPPPAGWAFGESWATDGRRRARIIRREDACLLDEATCRLALQLRTEGTHQLDRYWSTLLGKVVNLEGRCPLVKS